ncbi:hypothetical protein E6W39_19075 [Kitasatospora acidiphila]|uniref:Zinc finger CHC2-type domain-containing protein n=1 Tax=Kitasatospora acidiphila TaxID=2567942 RepID=A0A540W4J2_9ACTN|nr:hypothetical protein E6W39_19075 [Kitasatospora acidiphila]
MIRHYHPDAIVPVREWGWQKMRCPFHGERNPSASVNLEANYFQCFVCDASGDSWAIIMKEEGCDFRSAVEFAEGTLRFSGGEIRGGSSVQRRRGFLSDEARPVRGQRSILQTRGRRRPLSGT